MLIYNWLIWLFKKFKNSLIKQDYYLIHVSKIKFLAIDMEGNNDCNYASRVSINEIAHLSLFTNLRYNHSLSVGFLRVSLYLEINCSKIFQKSNPQKIV